MNDARRLFPAEAEAIVAERIEQFGPGSLPAVRVVAINPAEWEVRWDHQVRTVAPMNRGAWRDWLTANVGSLDAGDLQTTES